MNIRRLALMPSRRGNYLFPKKECRPSQENRVPCTSFLYKTPSLNCEQFLQVGIIAVNNSTARDILRTVFYIQPSGNKIILAVVYFPGKILKDLHVACIASLNRRSKYSSHFYKFSCRYSISFSHGGAFCPMFPIAAP